MSLEFYQCLHCGNIAIKPFDSGVPLVCCGEKMAKVEPNTVDAAREKHLPEVTIEGNAVRAQVGSVEHPMEEVHYITFVCLETEKGYQIAHLTPGMAPVATFAVAEGDKSVAVYEYCNKHGLWKVEL